jgi:hypothetical protein
MFPVLMLAGLAARAGATWPAIERLFILFPLAALITCVPYAFAFRLLRHRQAAAVAALLFAVNTWTIGLIERGHLPSLLAYALIPPVAFVCIRAVERPTVRAGLTLALAAFASTLFEPRYTYMAALAGGVLWLAGVAQSGRARDWTGYAKFWGAFVAGTSVLNLYWLLPVLLCPIVLPRSESGLESFLSQRGLEDFVHGFAGFYPFYHHIVSNDPFQPYPVEWPFLLFAALAIAGFIAGWRSPLVRSFVPLWAAAIVLAGGPHSVAGPLNVWIFTHVPGMSGFRDSTKWLALVEFAQAFGVAVFVRAAAARVRLRNHRRIGAALAIALAAVWVGAMNDAFNPLRFSNFSTTVPTAGDLAYAAFLTGERTPGRVLYFPAMPSEFTPSVQHPGVEAFHLAQAYAPEGIAELNPNPAGILAFFQSPLIAALLCQGDVRYVTVVPDRYSSLYTPFNRATTRGEALTFFRSVAWLQEVPRAGAPEREPAGDYVVFRVRGCSASAESAFVAPYPVAFNGSAGSLTSLVGTPLWSDRAAVLLAEQQQPRTFRRSANVVNGVPFVSKERENSGDPEARTLRARLAAASSIALHVDKPFEGFAFDQGATDQIFDRNLQTFSFSFSRTRPGTAGILLRIEPRTDEHGTLLAENFTGAAPPELADSPAAELVDPSGFTVGEPAAGSRLVSLGRPGIPWMTGGNQGLTLDVINPLSVPAFADIELPGIVSLQGDGLPLAVTLGESRVLAWAPPRVLLDVFNYAPNVWLRHVLLPLGVSSLRVGPAQDDQTPVERRFAVSTGIALSNKTPAARFGRWTKLRVTSSTSVFGTKFALSEPYPSGAPSHQEYRLMGGLSIPLALQPQFKMRYVAPRSPYSLRLAFDIDHDARHFEFKVTVPQSQSVIATDITPAVQRALDGIRREDLRDRALDVGALVKSASTPHDDAATYVLRGVALEIVKAGNATASASAAVVRAASLEFPRSAAGAPIVRDAFTSDFSRPRAFRAPAADNVRLERIDAAGARLHLSVTLQPPQQLGLPNDPHPGDHIALQLANGTAYNGTVLEATPDTLVLRQGTSADLAASTIGIQRSSIATISQLLPDARGGVSFEVPVSDDGQGRQLSFLLAASPLFQTKLTLLVRDRRTHRDYTVFPQDRGLVESSEPVIPPQWVSAFTNLSESVPVPLGVPWFERDRSQTLRADDFQHYALDLPAIYASELPALRDPELLALRVAFSLSGNAPVTGPTQADITLANVELKRWTFDWPLKRGGALPPRLLIDGRALAYCVIGAQQKVLYATARAAVGAGTHVVAAPSGADSTVVSAFAAFGAPVRTPFAALRDASSPSASELAGRLSTGGGLVVVPRTYSTGWAAALPPAGVVPSGNALLDYVRLRPYLVPSEDHVSVNDIFNGWFVPHADGTVVFLFLPTAFGELGAGLEAILLLAALTLFVSRRLATR